MSKKANSKQTQRKKTVALTDEQIKAITEMMDQFIETLRPIPEIRHLNDVGWRLKGHSVYVFELKEPLMGLDIRERCEFARAVWITNKNHWQIFYRPYHHVSMQYEDKWEPYMPLKTAGNLQRFLIEIKKDPCGCFRG